MKLEFDINMASLDDDKPNGQVSIKLPKQQEERYRNLNKKYKRKLSKIMRSFALKLMDAVDPEWPKVS